MGVAGHGLLACFSVSNILLYNVSNSPFNCKDTISCASFFHSLDNKISRYKMNICLY